MILSNNTNARSFIFCSVYFGPHENNTYFNEGPGHFHQWLYLVEGQAQAKFSQTKSGDTVDHEFELQKDQLYNLADSYGKYVITNTADQGASMIMFNPIPDDKNLSIDILKGPHTQELSAGQHRTTVVCINGPVSIKNKELESLQFATLLPNSSGQLEIPANCTCAIVRG